jgi:hypothetical protein
VPKSVPCGKKIFRSNNSFEKVAVNFHEWYG